MPISLLAYPKNRRGEISVDVILLSQRVLGGTTFRFREIYLPKTTYYLKLEVLHCSGFLTQVNKQQVHLTLLHVTSVRFLDNHLLLMKTLTMISVVFVHRLKDTVSTAVAVAI